MPKRPRLRSGGGRQWSQRDTCSRIEGPEQNGVKEEGLGNRAGQGFSCPPSRGRGTPEGEWLKIGEGLSCFPVTPSVFPIHTSQTPRFSPVAKATAPARRGHQGNPVPASSPPPHHWQPPPSQAALVWRVGGAMEEKNPDSRPRKGGPDLPTLRRPPSQAYILNPTAGYAATARRAPPTRPVPRQL